MPRRIDGIIHSSALVLVICLITACSGGSQAAINETWTLVELITKGERIDTVPETVEVRNCGIPEHKSIECSAGTSNDLSINFGLNTGTILGIEVTINPSVSSSLGLGRNSGQSLDLDLPPDGFIYMYTISKKYSVMVGEVLARSTESNEQRPDYTFNASCSLKIESRETLTCQESELPFTPTPTPQPIINIPEAVVPQESCASTPPNGLVHFWKEGLPLWSEEILWSKGIWGSENIVEFTVGVAIVDTDDPDFGEFRLWIDPCFADTVPGHGYKNGARFWPLDPLGAGLTSPPIILEQEAIIKLEPNTGRWALGNPE